MNRQYIAIDLKSFYASVECMERGLDPLTTNLVVADASRTEKTICLAVTPSLKAYGIPGRVRLFEVVEKVRQANDERRRKAPEHRFSGSSVNATELAENPALAIDYLVASPQMAHYMKLSTQIYRIYLRYIAPEDIHVYSIDEVFLDVTGYLKIYQLSARDLAMRLIKEVLKETGITATAGIGTNLYLAKIAMDIVAKHLKADRDGVRIADLDEMSYRRLLWTHRPLTDFWRVGRGYADKLQEYGLYTMGDIARCSLRDEELLYRLFGINAELLIDHAWGVEPCTIADIKAYRPENHSISQGQVLPCPYEARKAKLVIREMTEILSLELVEKGLLADQLVLTVCYDVENTKTEEYQGKTEIDRYGRKVPKQAHGSENIGRYTSSSKQLVEAAMRLYDRIVNQRLSVRRIYVVLNHVTDEKEIPEDYEQLELFTDYEEKEKQQKKEEQERKREKQMQQTMIALQKKFGKNSVLKGINLEDGATAIQRNKTIGGHKA